VIVPDSHWRLSLCINRGNASQALALKRGGRVRLTRYGEPGCRRRLIGRPTFLRGLPSRRRSGV
jgi:hypothetical protein